MSDDRDRFTAAFTAHYPAVTRYAVRRVGPDAAQEIVAETFLVAWRRWAEAPDATLPWLYAIARRVLANELRRQGRSRRLGERVRAQPVVAAPDPGELVPQRLTVDAALATLSERDREVLLLTEWEQLSHAEGARVLGCTSGAFKLRLHRARRRLARELACDADAPPATLVREGEAR